MKIAVINFSGNVGKTTISRHLLLPRIPGAVLIAVESINAEKDQETRSLRGRQFADLQEFMQTVDNVVVDIGASNVEDLMEMMRRYQGSHEDFDCFLVPTVLELKQINDTIATLLALSEAGVQPAQLKVIFNMVPEGVDVNLAFEPLLAFLQQRPVASASPHCRLGENEVYARVAWLGARADLSELAQDGIDYKALIARASDIEEKLALAQKLGTRRLACGVLPELDTCFAALQLESVEA